MLGFSKEDIQDRRRQFDREYEHVDPIDLQKDLLFVQKLNLEKMEAIRSNSSKILWLVLIQFTIWVLLLMAG